MSTFQHFINIFCVVFCLWMCFRWTSRDFTNGMFKVGLFLTAIVALILELHSQGILK